MSYKRIIKIQLYCVYIIFIKKHYSFKTFYIFTILKNTKSELYLYLTKTIFTYRY